MTIYAIMAIHGHQVHVQVGRYYRVQAPPILCSGPDPLPYRMYRVLMMRDVMQCLFGQPWVYGAALGAHLFAAYRSHKIIIYKMKAKKKMRRKLGYRHAQYQWQVCQMDLPAWSLGYSPSDTGPDRVEPLGHS